MDRVHISLRDKTFSETEIRDICTNIDRDTLAEPGNRPLNQPLTGKELGTVGEDSQANQNLT